MKANSQAANTLATVAKVIQFLIGGTCTGNNLSVHKAGLRGWQHFDSILFEQLYKNVAMGNPNTPCVVCDRKINVHTLVHRLLLRFSHIPYVQERSLEPGQDTRVMYYCVYC